MERKGLGESAEQSQGPVPLLTAWTTLCYFSLNLHFLSYKMTGLRAEVPKPSHVS